MIEAIDLGLTFLQMFVGKLGSNLPAEIVTAIQAAIDALSAHKNDLITKAAIDSQRG